MVNSIECEIAAKLLDMAADEFSCHGCGDFDLVEAGCTEEEIDQITCGLQEWSGDPFFEPGEEVVLDWMLMRYLATRLREDHNETT